MKTEKVTKGWSLLQKTLLEVFESSVKLSVSCTELLAQRKAVEYRESLYFFVGVLLITVAALTSLLVGDLVQRDMFGYNIKTVVYLAVVLFFAFGGIRIFNCSLNFSRGLNQN
jgi:uncharacterized membrane protein (DUF441 family)